MFPTSRLLAASVLVLISSLISACSGGSSSDSNGAVVAAWLDSPGHCLNIMNATFSELGAGSAENPASTYGIYWAQNFGDPL